MFTDSATILVRGGNGGNGTVAWRREKYVAMGGPNGGDGGNGGSVVFRASPHTDTLSDYHSKKRFQAENGKAGGGDNMHGRSGENVELLVPPGTLIYEILPDGSKSLLIDLDVTDAQALVCKGGRGGFGNAHFVSSVRQSPDFAELGEEGEVKQLFLELKLVADVGIIGYPSVGKSSIIAAISAAKPKIAAYEFTTLVPNLGVVEYNKRSYVVCDVPGLIEGAADGKGLGHTFLKHIERCRVLLHVLSIERAVQNTEGRTIAEALLHDYNVIRKELEKYSPVLPFKHECIYINKTDILTPEELEELLQELKASNVNVWSTGSTFNRDAMNTLKKELLTVVLTERERAAAEVLTEEPEEVVLTPGDEVAGTVRDYRVDITEERVTIIGKRIEQIVSMTNFTQPGAVARLKDVLERIGIATLQRRNPRKAIIIGTTNVTNILSDEELLDENEDEDGVEMEA
jgi:GTPase